jgi:tRNA-dihydrouridine synthase A
MIVDETLVYNTLPFFDDVATTGHLQLPPEHVLPPAANHRSTTIMTKPNIIICQLGGIRPDWTGIASRLVVAAGYKYEINLNLDCPSNRVQGKQFGAVLLKDAEKVVKLLSAMKKEVAGIPISVKMRVGIIDDTINTDFQWLVRMVERLSSVCTRFIIHARAVLLKGLSPEQNRNIPPLNYPFVYELCDRFPHLDFWINGGINGLKSAKDIVYGLQKQPDSQRRQQEQKHQVPCSLCGIWNGSCVAAPQRMAPCNLRGCLLGRAAIDNPAQFWDTDRYFYGEETDDDNKPFHQTRRKILEAYCDILEDLYPRRCCDEDFDQVTSQLPSPRVVYTKAHCEICREHPSFYNHHPLLRQHRNDDDASRIKITSHIMDRALKPFLGMFYGLRGCRAFRRRCEELSRNIVVRNCGPAFVLRLAVFTTISDAILDQPLVRTEDLHV